MPLSILNHLILQWDEARIPFMIIDIFVLAIFLHGQNNNAEEETDIKLEHNNNNNNGDSPTGTAKKGKIRSNRTAKKEMRAMKQAESHKKPPSPLFFLSHPLIARQRLANQRKAERNIQHMRDIVKSLNEKEKAKTTNE